ASALGRPKARREPRAPLDHVRGGSSLARGAPSGLSLGLGLDPAMSDARTPQTTKIRLALICDSLEDNFQSALADAAIAAATTYLVDLLVVPGGKPRDASGKAFVHDLVLEWVDGVIVAAHTSGQVGTEQQMRAFIERLRPVPTVALGEVAGA